MATFPTWVTKIGIGRESTWGVGVAASNRIPSGGPKGLPTTNHPDFLQGASTIESNKYHGAAYRRSDVSERMRGILLPGTTLEFDFTPEDIIPFLCTLFQRDGSNALQAGSGVFTKTFRTYTADPDLASKAAYMAPETAGSSVPMSLTLVKETGASSEGHELNGAISRTLTVSGEVDQPLKCSTEIIAKAMTTNNDTSSDVFTFSNDTTALFQDMVFELATVATNITSFNFTISNNATQKTYDNQTVQKILYGIMDVTGSFTLPWDGANTILDAYKGAISSNMQLLEFYGGTSNGDGLSDTDGDYYFKLYAALKGYREVEQDGERMMEIDFESLYDGTNLTTGPIYITIGDGLQYAAV